MKVRRRSEWRRWRGIWRRWELRLWSWCIIDWFGYFGWQRIISWEILSALRYEKIEALFLDWLLYLLIAYGRKHRKLSTPALASYFDGFILFDSMNQKISYLIPFASKLSGRVGSGIKERAWRNARSRIFNIYHFCTRFLAIKKLKVKERIYGLICLNLFIKKYSNHIYLSKNIFSKHLF